MHVRFDWLTVTFKDKGPDDVRQLLSDVFWLDYDLFNPIRGRYGYRDGMFFENISVLMNGGVAGMGVCFDISGKGCTYLYNSTCGDTDHNDPFEYIFKVINGLGGFITRLDVALDCFDNELSYDDMYEAYEKHNYSSRWKRVELTKSRTKVGDGFNLQFGSRRSDIMLRIYNKKVEQNDFDHDYWCRLELQCRNDLAHSFADTYLDRDDIAFVHLFLGVLCNYMRFIDRIYDYSNANKCPTLSWWQDFIVLVEKIVILRHEDYQPATMDKLIYNVQTRFAQCYRVFLECFGSDALLDILSNCEVKNRHYKSLIEHFRELEKEKGFFVVRKAYLG